MIGVCAVFVCWRINSAVSMPSMSGMFTSSRMTATSRRSSSRNASAPERGQHEILAELLEHGPVREQLVG